MTIGERLEEARKRKGVSIREAAEATKIRGDFLLSMENNSFDIALPDIYVRGFLKIYGRYLSLDVEKILTDFDAIRMGSANRDRRGQTPPPHGQPPHPPTAPGTKENTAGLLGRMDLPSDPDFAEGGPEESERDGEIKEKILTDRDLYIRIGVIFVSLLVLVFLLFKLVDLVSSDRAPELNPDLSTREPAPPQPTVPVPAATAPEPITVRASADVAVIVEQVNDRGRLFEGRLRAGEERTFDAVGPVRIRFMDGSALTVERNGQNYQMSQGGKGFSVIP